jgi:hypothetical protein
METNMTGKDIQITVILCMFINPQSPATLYCYYGYFYITG